MALTVVNCAGVAFDILEKCEKSFRVQQCASGLLHLVTPVIAKLERRAPSGAILYAPSQTAALDFPALFPLLVRARLRKGRLPSNVRYLQSFHMPYNYW